MILLSRQVPKYFSVLKYFPVLFLLFFTSTIGAQTPSVAAPVDEGAQKYYTVVGLGSSEADTLVPYPFPMAVLALKDTNLYRIRVRFPHLGILGMREDTVWQPNFRFDDSVVGYRPNDALYHFSIPVTPYIAYADVFDRRSQVILESHPLAYQMNVERFASSRIDHVYDPQAGLNNPLLRRRFSPKLLPLSLEVNPGWRGREQFDSSGTYSLVFTHPENASDVKLSVTMRAASVSDIDSASWSDFKTKARQAFGDQGAPTSSIGNFLVGDIPTRSVLRGGYEMLAKRPDGSFDYIAAMLTPKAIVLIMAPLKEAPSAEYDYVRSIVRSFQVKPITK